MLEMPSSGDDLWLETMCEQLERKFPSTSPLCALGERLVSGIRDRQWKDAKVQAKMIELANFCLNHFSDTQGDRFWLDSEMIQAAAQEISANGGPLLSGYMVPVYNHEWGHFSAPIASGDPLQAHVVNLILLPGKDRLSDVDLWQYPLLYHEVAHMLLEKHGHPYEQNILTAFEKEANMRRIKAMNDSPSLKIKLKRDLVELEEFWQPRNRQQGWAVEVAADTIALWLCGPAYIEVMLDVFAAIDDPYLLTTEHPPYESRALVLRRVANSLGWHENVPELDELLWRWRNNDHLAGRSNVYLSFAAHGLLGECIACAMELCETLRLPPCEPSLVTRLASETIRDGSTPKLNFQLSGIVHVLKRRLPGSEFARWQSEVLSTHTINDADEQATP